MSPRRWVRALSMKCIGAAARPTCSQPAEFLRLVHHIDFWFDILPGARHAIELDPRHVTAELARAYAAAGVSRVSLGVQDLNAHVQEAIGRVQPFEQVRDAVNTLRDAGLNELSFDLMYGLPLQTCADVARTIKLAADLKPHRIALFGYAHVPWFKRRQRLINAEALPGVRRALRPGRAGAAHALRSRL